MPSISSFWEGSSIKQAASEGRLTPERRRITEGTAEVSVSIKAAKMISRTQIEIKRESWRAEGAAE